jgi:hypothetical protein
MLWYDTPTAAPWNNVYVFPTCAFGSTHSGSTATLSNHQVLQQAYKDHAIEVVDGNRFYATAFSATWLTGDGDDVTKDNLLDTLYLAFGGRAIDKFHLDDLESRLIEDEWWGWCYREFVDAIGRRFLRTLRNEKAVILTVFKRCCARANVGWTNDGMGHSMRIDVERVARAAELSDVEPYFEDAED